MIPAQACPRKPDDRPAGRPHRTRHPIAVLLVATIAAWLPSPHSQAAEDEADSHAPPRRPNLVFILVDDLGKEWVSCYGAEGIETPHVDALAAGGMRFENAWSMPQCTPTRAALLTGQYPWRNGWINHWDVPRWGSGCHFDPDANPSFARILRGAGYRTCVAGKWQINDFRVQPDVMDAHGFDEWCLWTGFETGNPPSAERYWNPYVHTREGSATREGAFGDDVFADFIVDFMRRHRDEPFAVYFPMCLTHGPLTTTPTEPDAAGKLGRFRAMVRHADHLLGRLVATLEELRLREKTIVIWTTDNGSPGGIDGRIGGRTIEGGKGKTLETGINAPFIANGPGIVPAGVVTDALVDLTDVLPTFAELAGAELPADVPCDGRSFAPLLTGRADDSPRRWILAMGGQPGAYDPERKRVVNRTVFRDRVLRDKRFKLYVGTDRKPAKLVDLAADPDESRNLLDSDDPEVTAARDALVAVAASFPDKDANPRYAPLPPQPWDAAAPSLKPAPKRKNPRDEP